MRVPFRLFTTLTLFCSLLFVSHAQVQWEYMGGPNFTEIDDSWVAEDGDLYVSVYDKPDSKRIVYRSSDRGGTWQLVPLPVNMSSMLFAEMEQDVLLCYSVKKLFRSSDNGASWSKVDSTLSIPQRLFMNTQGTYIITSYSSSVNKVTIVYSTDAGETWLPILGPAAHLPISDVCIDSQNRIYTTTRTDTVFATTDFGTTWSIHSKLAFSATGLFIDSNDNLTVTNKTRVASSTDRGATWPLDFALPDTTYVRAMNAQGLLVASRGEDTVLVSSDRGATWSFAFRTPLRNRFVRRMYFDYKDDLVLETLFGLYIAQNGTWEISRPFFMHGNPMQVVEIEELPGGNLIVQNGRYGVFRTTLDGDNWTGLYDQFIGWDGHVNSHISLANGSILRFGLHDVDRSTDGGLRYSAYSKVNAFLFISALADSRGTLFAQTGYSNYGYSVSRGIHYSTDEGLSWLPLSDSGVTSILLGLDADDNVYTRGHPDGREGLWYSSDGFATTSNVINPPQGDTRITPQGHIYTIRSYPGRDSTWLYTTNKGASWHNIPFPPAPEMCDFIVDRNGCIYTAHTVDTNTTRTMIMFSCDKGSTWTDASEGIQATDFRYGRFYLGSNGHLYLGTWQGLFRTTAPVYTGVESPQPITYEVAATYPNPISSGQDVQVTFGLERNGELTLSLYSVLGVEVRSVQLGQKSVGSHQYTIPTRGLAPGVYQVVIRGPGAVKTGRVVVR